jgi:hypothetical protein
MLRELIVCTIASLLTHIAVASPAKGTKSMPAPAATTESTASRSPLLPKISAKKDLSRKITMGKGSTTNINLETVSVTGERVSSGASSVGSIKGDPSFELIQIRRNWHSEMQKAEIPHKH